MKANQEKEKKDNHINDTVACSSFPSPSLPQKCVWAASAMVKVDQNVPGPHNFHKIVILRSWARNLLSFCPNFGVWLPELCSEVLNPETVLATNLA